MGSLLIADAWGVKKRMGAADDVAAMTFEMKSFLLLTNNNDELSLGVISRSTLPLSFNCSSSGRMVFWILNENARVIAVTVKLIITAATADAINCCLLIPYQYLTSIVTNTKGNQITNHQIIGVGKLKGER